MWKTNLIAVLTSSLQRKLMLALIAIASVVIGVGGMFLLSSQQQSAAAGLEARAAYMTGMLSKSLAGPLWNIDLKSIQDQLDMVMSDPEIHSVALYQDEQKQPLALKKRDSQAVDGIERDSPVIYVRDPSQPPAELGRVRIVYTRSYVYQALREERMMILAGILLLLASLLTATYFLLRRMVQKPIEELLAMAHRIAEGDLEARIPVTSRDEIGLLSEKFNYMTEKLKQTMEGLGRSEQNYRNINESLEVRIHERTEELRQLLRSAGEGMFGVDTQERITFFNAAAEKLLGYRADEVLGQEIHGLIHHSYADGTPYPRENCPTFLALVHGEKRHVADEALWRKDGSKFPSEYSVTPIYDDQAGVVGAVIVFRDITERKGSEEELSRRMEDLERFNRLTMGREHRMIQLKREINTLLEEMGREKKYRVVEDGN
jgi:PAS domain S-box-containing protein